MPWDGYEVDGDGAFTFLDSSNGRRMRTAPVPSAQELAAELDAAKAPAAPMTPAPMPVESVVVDTSPMMRRDLAQEAPSAADQGAPGAAGAAPPPEVSPPPGPEGAGGAPQAPAAGAPSAAAPAPAPAAVGPGNIVFKPGMDTTGMTPAQVAAYAHYMAGLKKLRGSPGYRDEGGTFPTGSTEQLSRGPDPGATLGREAAERRLGNAQSDLIYVQSRAAEEQALNAQEQARIAADRQKQIEEINARQQAKLGQIFEQIDTTSKELADAKVDPNRWVNSLSTGEQIMAGLAMVFGGAGRGLTGEQGPPLAMQAFDDAIRGDIENQKYAIEKKRGDLNALGTTYRLAFEKFGDEKLASEAAYLAGLEIVKAKIAKTVAEADAAQGTETQWSDGQIVAGPPYSIKAKAMLAQLAVDQAKIRESLSQAANGQVTQQYVTTQPRIVGAVAGDDAGAAKEFDAAAKVLGDDGAQQKVMFDGQRYTLGKFAESGEGKQTRDELGKIENLDVEAAGLEKYLTENPIGSKTYDSSIVEGKMERLSSGANVILGQGAKNNDEAARWNKILGGVTTNGVGAVKDARRWLKDLAQRKLDQLEAKPVTAGGGFVIPQDVQDYASGKKRPSAGGPAGMPRQAGVAPAPATIVRNNGALASPLDRATAAAVQAKTGEGKARESAATLARAALKSALASGQLGQGEYKTALGLVDDGQYDELMGFLGRMGGSAGGPPPGPRRPAVDPATQMMLNRSIRETTQALSGGPSVKTVVTTKTGKR